MRKYKEPWKNWRQKFGAELSFRGWSKKTAIKGLKGQRGATIKVYGHEGFYYDRSADSETNPEHALLRVEILSGDEFHENRSLINILMSYQDFIELKGAFEYAWDRSIKDRVDRKLEELDKRTKEAKTLQETYDNKDEYKKGIELQMQRKVAIDSLDVKWEAF